MQWGSSSVSPTFVALQWYRVPSLDSFNICFFLGLCEATLFSQHSFSLSAVFSHLSKATV